MLLAGKTLEGQTRYYPATLVYTIQHGMEAQPFLSQRNRLRLEMVAVFTDNNAIQMERDISCPNTQ